MFDRRWPRLAMEERPGGVRFGRRHHIAQPFAEPAQLVGHGAQLGIDVILVLPIAHLAQRASMISALSNCARDLKNYSKSCPCPDTLYCFGRLSAAAETTRRDAFMLPHLAAARCRPGHRIRRAAGSSCRPSAHHSAGSSLTCDGDLECQGYRVGTDQLKNDFNNSFTIYFILSNNYLFYPIIAIYRRAIIVSCQAYQLS
jgi:hypothetical protein